MVRCTVKVAYANITLQIFLSLQIFYKDLDNFHLCNNSLTKRITYRVILIEVRLKLIIDKCHDGHVVNIQDMNLCNIFSI